MPATDGEQVDASERGLGVDSVLGCAGETGAGQRTDREDELVLGGQWFSARLQFSEQQEQPRESGLLVSHDIDALL